MIGAPIEDVRKRRSGPEAERTHTPLGFAVNVEIHNRILKLSDSISDGRE